MSHVTGRKSSRYGPVSGQHLKHCVYGLPVLKYHILRTITLMCVVQKDNTASGYNDRNTFATPVTRCFESQY